MVSFVEKEVDWEMVFWKRLWFFLLLVVRCIIIFEVLVEFLLMMMWLGLFLNLDMCF